MSPAERRTLERVARGEFSHGFDRRLKTLESLELRGLIRWWPGDPPTLTEAGRTALEIGP